MVTDAGVTTLIPMPVHISSPFWGWVFLIQTIAILVGIGIWWLWSGEYKRRGMVLPILFAGTALSSVLIEPIFDNVLLYWYPPENPLAFFTGFGRTLPWYVPLGYAWLFGGGGYLIQRQFEKGIDLIGVWKLYALFILLDWVATSTAGWFGLSAFYGNQPFVYLGACPLWFSFVDATGSFMMAAAVQIFLPVLTGTKRAWLLLLPTFTYGATLGTTTAPITMALNSGWSAGATWLAGTATMAMCCAVIYVISIYATRVSDSR
jgi:hypothetical protein